MTEQPSYTQLVAQVLTAAAAPLTLDEILARVSQLRPVSTKNPRATVRGAISSLPLATTLGGRPARYAWWPHYLTGSTFRQPLSAADIASGGLVLGQELWLTFWPDFYTGGGRSAGEVRLELADGPVVETQVQHLVSGEAVWGFPPLPPLAAWYQHQQALPGDELLVEVDLDSRPFMRALHGQGLCLWRLGQIAEARAIFARMLALNPNDNQGARFLIHDLDAGLSWEEGQAQEVTETG